MGFAVKYLLLLICLAGPAFAGPYLSGTAFETDAEQIRRSMLEIEKAFVSSDPSPFEKLYLDGYVSIRGKPVYNSREQLIAMLRRDAAARSGKKLDFETLSYESEEPRISVYGDAAIVNVLKKNLWRYKDDRCLSRYQATELWIKEDGVWKVAAGHMSTIQCDAVPWQPPHPALKDLPSQTRPVKFLSAGIETEIRELVSDMNEAGLRGQSNADAFLPEFSSTSVAGEVSGDRSSILSTLRLPLTRSNERYRDDEVYLNFGSAALYIFRVRTVAKIGAAAPEPPVNYSVFFVKKGGAWQVAAAHASSIQDSGV